MKRATKAGMGVCWGLALILCLCGFSGLSIPQARLVNTREFSAEGLLGVEAHYAADRIVLLESDSDVIVLKEYSSHPIAGCNATAAVADGMLIIRGGERPQKVSYRAYVELYIPADFAGSIALTTASGPIESVGTGFQGAVSCSTASGRIQLSDVSSGFDCNTASGMIQVDGEALQGKISTASGLVSVGVDGLAGDLEIAAASGTVAIALSPAASFRLTASIASGEISNAFDAQGTARRQVITHGSQPSYGITIGAASGKIEITQKAE